MCLAVPAKVLTIEDEGPTRMARVELAGVTQRVSLAYLPDVGPGEYVIVHVGFALQRLDEQEALRSLEIFAELAAATEQLE
ncbi:MAG: hydrogenase expression/formation protein HypC [Actinomycetota bacterium]|nr:hydrogenase expression/formation protein HypC [Actinomycetota bacterium]